MQRKSEILLEHAPDEPVGSREKLEGGKKFVLNTEFTPAGDQPSALGTLQAQPLVCEVHNGRASHSTPAEGAGFWPIFRQNRGTPPKAFHGWGGNGDVPPVLVCLGGCLRTPLYLPRPSEVDVAPSSLAPHRTVRAERPEIGDSPCRKVVGLLHGTSRWLCRPGGPYTCWEGSVHVPMAPGDTASPTIGL